MPARTPAWEDASWLLSFGVPVEEVSRRTGLGISRVEDIALIEGHKARQNDHENPWKTISKKADAALLRIQQRKGNVTVESIQPKMGKGVSGGSYEGR